MMMSDKNVYAVRRNKSIKAAVNVWSIKKQELKEATSQSNNFLVLFLLKLLAKKINNYELQIIKRYRQQYLCTCI